MDGWLVGHVAAAVVVMAVLWARGMFKAGALGAVRGVGELPWWVWMSCAAVTWLMQVVGASVAHEVWGVGPGSDSPREMAVLGLMSTGTALAGSAALLVLVKRVASGAGIECSARSVLLGVGLAAGAWPVLQSVGFAMTWVHGVVGGAATEQVAHPMLKMIVEQRGDPWVWVLMGVSIVGVPVVEEVIYRGFVQSLILRATGRPWLTVIASGVLFGAAHLGQGIPWYSVVVVGTLGVAIGMAFERTKRLGVCIGMHVAFNGANVGLALMMGAG
ncbi:MAG: hypothetical protein HBSAPP03_07020 [Phycisphaerae bacterium]|nr:MAG: hypothetical protein HBSAPP03_07020 [Phycisphaerae bacterium]